MKYTVEQLVKKSRNELIVIAKKLGNIYGAEQSSKDELINMIIQYQQS